MVTYGFNAQADVRAVNLSYAGGVAHFDIRLSEGQVIDGCTLPMPGDHNVSNALAAVAVARHLGMKGAEIRDALAGFKGVNRRFTKVGEVNGVTIIDDYGHHPVEIAAVLKAARQAIGLRPAGASSRCTSRTAIRACRRCSTISAPASTRPTWSPSPRSSPAGEEPIPGASRDDLVAGLVAHGHRHARAILTEDDLERLVRAEARPGDIVVCLGAGTISAWAHGLPGRLQEG